jgi:hypothetical protein
MFSYNKTFIYSTLFHNQGNLITYEVNNDATSQFSCEDYCDIPAVFYSMVVPGSLSNEKNYFTRTYEYFSYIVREKNSQDNSHSSVNFLKVLNEGLEMNFQLTSRKKKNCWIASEKFSLSILTSWQPVSSDISSRSTISSPQTEYYKLSQNFDDLANPRRFRAAR